ncbi:hypothetical protein GTQ40_16395 [Flavobacteriaceae bacterium R38]|nr:hypothetical protein [Flavobacteriaceae bacterium R38]
MKVVERIKLFIDYKNISLRSFDESIGMSKGYMSRQIKTNASIGSDVLVRIIDAYPELNLIWLLKGTGKMIVSSDIISDIEGIYETPDAFAGVLLEYLDQPLIRKKIQEILNDDSADIDKD